MTARDALLLTLSTAVCFAGGEVAVRYLLPPPYRLERSLEHSPLRRHVADPEIGWVITSEAVQSRDRYIGEKDGKIHYDVAYTLRDGERVTSRTGGQGPEIILTGCSFTFGHGLNDQDTWPWLLQERLPGHRVCNVAAMGYGTDQAILAAERRLRRARQPRVVILGFAGFQIERNRSTQGWMKVAYPFSKPIYRLQGDKIERGPMVRFLSLGSFLDRSDLLAHLCNKLGNRFYRIPTRTGARELTVRLIADFAARLRSSQVKFVVVILPWGSDSAEAEAADGRYVAEQLTRRDIPVLTPRFPRPADGRFDVRRYMVSEEEQHPNRAYTELLTSQLFNYLTENALL